MKKTIVRIFSLVLSLVMLLSVLPVASATVEDSPMLSGETKRLQTVDTTEEGIITFTTVEDLLALCAEAQSNPDTEYLCVYIGSGHLRISQSITIPANMVAATVEQDIYVNEGVTVYIDGILEAPVIYVYGDVYIREQGVLSAINRMNNYGTVYNDGIFAMYSGVNSYIFQEDKIVNGQNGSVIINGTISSPGTLVLVCETAARKNDGHWFYNFECEYLKMQLESSPVTIPSNCSIMVTSPLHISGGDLIICGYMDCTADFTITSNLTVQPGGYLAIGSKVAMEGTLTNLGEIAIVNGAEGYNGSLTITKPETYVDTADGIEGRIYVITQAGLEYPVSALPGINVNSFTVHWEQDAAYSYWTLTNYKHPAQPDTPVTPPTPEVVASGEWNGGDTKWELLSDGTLNISGVRNMQGTSTASSYPWRAHSVAIKKIVITGHTSIAREAFSDLPAVTSVVIGDTVQRIDTGAFGNCYNLQSVTIPSSVTEIQGGAFGGCTKLQSITIPASVTEIQAGAFARCTSLTTVTFDEGSQLTTLGNGVFSQSGIVHQEIPAGVKVLPEYTFAQCNKLTSVTLNEGLEEIKRYAFQYCESLTSISLPSTLSYIQQDAFSGCFKVNTIEMYHPISISSCFPTTNALTTVIIHGNTESVSGFMNCSNLSSITLPESIVRIEENAFRQCTSLKAFTWPENLTTIGAMAFAGSGLCDVTLPDTVTEVGASAFRNCGDLVSFSFGSGVTSVALGMFEECTNLSTVDLGNSRSIGFQAFYNCSSLQTIIWPDNLKTIGYSAFANCTALEKVVIPETVVEMDHSVFKNCINLTEIKFQGDAPSIGAYCFENVTATVYYPANNDTWTEEVMQDYGGNLTWVPYEVPVKTTTPMYRLYNPNSGEHFYTGSKDERDTLMDAGWQYEGVAWNAPIHEGTNVFRLYNPNNGDHHYTMSQEEVDNLVAVGWQYEGVCWNSAPEEGNVPLYRLYNPNADCGSHHYTGSEEERDNLVAAGWIYEGIGWYGIA